MAGVTVRLTVTRVSLPDQDQPTIERWYESWRLLMELDERLEASGVHALASVAAETESEEAI